MIIILEAFQWLYFNEEQILNLLTYWNISTERPLNVTFIKLQPSVGLGGVGH